MQFNVKKKLSPGQQKLLQDKTVFSMDNEIGSKTVQVLLNKNQIFGDQLRLCGSSVQGGTI
jgi:hypothetical protein